MLKDKREQLINDVTMMLSGKMDADNLTMMQLALTIVLDKYELQDRCTELVKVDSSNFEYIKLYLSTCIVEGKRKKTVKRYADELKRFEQTVGKNFNDITTYDIRKYFAVMLQRGVTKRTVENVRSCLAPFFRWMASEEIIEKDPMMKIKPIKCEYRQEDPFSDVEISMMRDAIVGPFDRALIEFLLATGARVSEVANMKIKDVDFKTNTVYIHDGKGGKDRKTYINDVAIRYLTNYLKSRHDDEDVLFRSKRGGALSDGGIRFRLNNVAAASGVDNVHPHRFRHTFASNMAKAGMSLQEIQILLGHSNIETTRLYVSTSQDQVKSKYMQIA